VIKPARLLPNVVVHAVAARDVARATAFAQRHGIPHVFPSYEALLASPDIDAVYVPSPNGLHKEHTLAALQAGTPIPTPIGCRQQAGTHSCAPARKARVVRKATGVQQRRG
jgi:hypothetical protein